MFISFIVVILQCMYTSKHCNIYHKYIQFLFINYTSINIGEVERYMQYCSWQHCKSKNTKVKQINMPIDRNIINCGMALNGILYISENYMYHPCIIFV